MRKKHLLPYLAAWFIYVLFSFSMYPELKITVLLFSIPLTMLGGWLFEYKGALTTTLLTIPYHYIMLRYHSNLPSVQLEAINPVGIGTQLFFSLGTALFRVTHLRYLQLNHTLEMIVQERTQELTQLTDHLIETKEMMFALTENGLLREPINRLTSMLGSGKLLAQHLKDKNHPGFETAETIEDLIHLCIHQLNTIGKEKTSAPGLSEKFDSPIAELVYEFNHLAGYKTKIISSGNWNRMKHETQRRLLPIIHEAVTNAIRHAHPTKIMIGLQNKPYTSVVTIENDGSPMPDRAKEGMGIPLMRYHAQRAGGSFSYDEGTNGNTRIECVIPRMSE